MVNNKKCLITDFDNTLFDWFDNWYSAFSGAFSYICLNFPGIDEKEVLNDIKAIHKIHNTTEYLNVFEDLAKLDRYSEFKNFSEICHDASNIRAEIKSQNLKLFSGVIETFKVLKNSSYKIVLFTESEAYSTSERVKLLGLDGIVDYIYSPPPQNSRSISLEHTQLVSFEKQEQYKPYVKNLNKILIDLNLNPDNCFYLGDSLIKDIQMAKDAGITDIYAQYGEGYKTRPEYQLLKDVTFWDSSIVRQEEQSSLTNIKPTFILEKSINEILSILQIKEETYHA